MRCSPRNRAPEHGDWPVHLFLDRNLGSGGRFFFLPTYGFFLSFTHKASMLVRPASDASTSEASNMSDTSGGPKRFCIIADERRRVHTTYPDQSEMIEEYNLDDDTIALRKFRRSTPFGGQGPWEYLIGAPPCSQVASTIKDRGGNLLLTPSSTSPICVMLDTKTAFEWRIRNLPYPKSTYQVSVDVETSEIVIRTTNKKYFKKLCIPEMSKLRIPMNPESLSWTHQHNTLVVAYLKPKAVCQYGVTMRYPTPLHERGRLSQTPTSAPCGSPGQLRISTPLRCEAVLVMNGTSSILWGAPLSPG